MKTIALMALLLAPVAHADAAKPDEPQHIVRIEGLVVIPHATGAPRDPVKAGKAAAAITPHLIDQPEIGNLNVFGPGVTSYPISAPELPGGSAVHIDVPAPKPDSHGWDSGASVITNGDIKAGDTVETLFWARSTSATGMIGARLERNQDPYDAIAEFEITPEKNWTLYSLSGKATQDFAASHVVMNLAFNSQAQGLDLGPVYILHNAGTVDIDGLKALPLGTVRDATITLPDGVKLAATLRLPAGAGPFPTVMMITGAGPNPREPSNVLSLALLDHGYAILQYDKRGVGQSTGTLDNTQTALRAHDADVVMTWLRQQPGVDPKHTGVLGHSEGGEIATMIAADDPAIAFAISLAGPAESQSEMIIADRLLTLKARGATPEAIAAATKVWRAGQAALMAATSDDDAEARTKAALAPFIGPQLSQGQIDLIAARVRDPVFRAQLLYDPAEALRRIHAPVLGLFGTADTVVPPGDNAAALRAGLTNDADVTVTLVPGFNHLFQRGSEQPMSDPELLGIVTGWLDKRTK